MGGAERGAKAPPKEKKKRENIKFYLFLSERIINDFRDTTKDVKRKYGSEE